MRRRTTPPCIAILLLLIFNNLFGIGRGHFTPRQVAQPYHKSTADTTSTTITQSEVRRKDEAQDDEERYSRQVYTLGARAHTLIRKATILIDAPIRSGLLWETVKNLALSGVGQIILVTSTDGESHEDYYHEEDLDDLWNVYHNGAKSECLLNDSSTGDEECTQLLLEYVRRLNPCVTVDTMSREDLTAWSQRDVSSDFEKEVGSNPVLMAIDRPQSTQILLNDACRSIILQRDTSETTIPFVSVETAGVYGRIFCDFGDDFQVVDEDGESPKSTILDKVVRSEGKGKHSGDIVVHCVEGERHDVSKGDRVQFQKTGEMMDDPNQIYECDVVYVKNPTCFEAKVHSRSQSTNESTEDDAIEDFISAINKDPTIFSRKKLPKVISFHSLKEALQKQSDPREEIFAASDLDKSFDVERRTAVMSSFAALDQFVKKERKLPTNNGPESPGDNLTAFVNIARKHEDQNDLAIGKDSEKILRTFAGGSKAKFAPLQCFYAAIGAQEALKAASGLYNPIKQFMLYDCDELVPSLQGGGTTTGLVYLLGNKLAKKLASRKLFVVGSGAIGCEILKNLSAMEAGTRKGGSIIVTDMDTIEKSNLSRQLLFRDSDVGKFKSVAAKEALHRLNPKVNVEAHTSKVGVDDSKADGGHFNDEFWSSGVDIILNALDNVEARLYIDSECVANRKGLIDAGTLGSKGNVQVVVPNQSESYGSSVDPPEPTIPVCTLKNFPYEISHTIQWGRDLFDGLFTRRPSQVNDRADNLSQMDIKRFSQMLVHDLGEEAALEAANEMQQDFLHVDLNRISSACMSWAVDLAKKFFHTNVKELLKQHPEDSLDDEGDKFWSGTRRAPIPLSFSNSADISSEQAVINKYLLDFVSCAYRLRIETYVSEHDISSDLKSPQPEDVEAALVEAFNAETTDDNDEDEDDESSVVLQIIDNLKRPTEIAKEGMSVLSVASFEKDDDTNGHVAFVTAASNLRALCYGIPPVDAMETRRIAGKIVPAMITTTALVSALSCIELVKLLQKVPLHIHRNAFANLALPFFAFTSPLPAEETPGLHGDSYTIWDKIVVKESEKSSSRGGITLRRMLRQVKKKACKEEEEVEISSVSFGPYMLYADFLHGEDDSVLDSSLWELLKDAIISGDEIEDDFDDVEDVQEPDSAVNNEIQQAAVESMEKKTFQLFTVVVEDLETGDEIELPPVKVIRWNRPT